LTQEPLEWCCSAQPTFGQYQKKIQKREIHERWKLKIRTTKSNNFGNTGYITVDYTATMGWYYTYSNIIVVLLSNVFIYVFAVC